MIELTDREQVAFDMLKKGPVIPEDIRIACENKGIGIKDNHSIVVMMKYLSSKVSQHGWIITNKGGVGRGKVAKYEMEKKF